MTQTHTIESLTFQVPADWSFENNTSETEITATISSAGASFVTLSLFRERPDPADLIETAIEAFRSEYEESDVYPVEAELCGRPTVASDLDFVCLDLVNSVFLRAFSTERFTVFILCQTDRSELAVTRAMFDKLTAAMVCSEEDFL